MRSISVGDTVRFLNSVGEGRVKGFQNKQVAIVEDEHGFDVPMLVSELVVIKSAEEELEKMTKELDLILNYVDKLSEVDVSNTKPLTGGHNLKNVLREDNPLEFNFDKDLLFQEVEFENGFIKVKRIIDK